MTIAGVDCGPRSPDVLDQPQRVVSGGVSIGGAVSSTDFGLKIQDVPIHFLNMPETTKNSLKAALMDTVKTWGTASVTPDAGDDLQIGASGATNLTFISFNARWLFGDRWEINILFRHYA